MKPGILGLDVSSSKIGIAIMGEDRKILTSEVIKLNLMIL